MEGSSRKAPFTLVLSKRSPRSFRYSSYICFRKGMLERRSSGCRSNCSARHASKVIMGLFGRYNIWRSPAKGSAAVERDKGNADVRPQQGREALGPVQRRVIRPVCKLKRTWPQTSQEVRGYEQMSSL